MKKIIIIFITIILLSNSSNKKKSELVLKAFYYKQKESLLMSVYVYNKGKYPVTIITDSLGPVLFWNGNNVSVMYIYIEQLNVDLHIVTIHPGETAEIDKGLFICDKIKSLPGFGEVTYEVSEEVGKRFDVWSGKLTTSPVPLKEKPK